MPEQPPSFHQPRLAVGFAGQQYATPFHNILNEVMTSPTDFANLFTPVASLADCHECTSLRHLQSHIGIKELLRLFDLVHLPARPGFNMGTGEVSLMIDLPAPEVWKSVAHCRDARKVVMWSMLGIGHDIDHLAMCAPPVPTLTTKESLSLGRKNANSWKFFQDDRDVLVGNRCLRTFTSQTDVWFSNIAVNYRQKRLKLSIAPPRDYNTEYFWYSPAYSRMGGKCGDDGSFSRELALNQSGMASDQMIGEFWEDVTNRGFMIEEHVRAQVTANLHDYLKEGIRERREGFQHKTNSAYARKPLAFYLEGTAGTGKSTFVGTFTKSLENVMRRWLSPHKRVHHVKVLLNSMTPTHLRNILHVRGISDWSVERVIEQGLSKGDVVVLHLEENPEDKKLQAELITAVDLMMGHLNQLYPQFIGNCIRMITSNYPPCDSVASRTHHLHVHAPSAESQHDWCQRMLAHGVSEKWTELKEENVSVSLNAPPPFVKDLRMLEQWRLSVSYQVVAAAEYLFERRGGVLTDGVLAVSIDPASDGPAADALTVTVECAGSGSVLTKSLTLCTTNSFFYYRHGEQQQDNELNSALAGIPADKRQVFETLVDMAEVSYIRPAVITLRGSNTEQRNRCVEAISESMRLRYGDSLHETRLTLTEDNDKYKVVGEPKEVLGGLFRFIDTVNNPNVGVPGRKDTGLIIINMNTLGQFIVRELLEDRNSSTHRQGVTKDRIFFVCNLIDDCETTPQLHSRSHDVFEF